MRSACSAAATSSPPRRCTRLAPPSPPPPPGAPGAGPPLHHARHEGGAISMADGYARVSGEVGVCSVHQGPGFTNALTGLTEAAKSRTPLLLIAGEAPAAALRSNFRIDQAGIAATLGAIPERIHSG